MGHEYDENLCLTIVPRFEEYDTGITTIATGTAAGTNMKGSTMVAGGTALDTTGTLATTNTVNLGVQRQPLYRAMNLMTQSIHIVLVKVLPNSSKVHMT